MKKLLTRILLLVCVVAIITSLIACSGKSEESQISNSSTVSSQTDNPATTDNDILKPIDQTTATNDDGSNTSTTEGGGGGDSDKTTRPPSNSKESKQEELFGNLKGTTVRVVVGPTLTDWEKKVYEDIKKKYQLKALDLVVYSYAEQQTKLPLLVVSGDTKNYLDVCTTGPTTLLRYVSGNVLMPIDKYLDKTDPAWNYAGSDPKDPICMLDMYKVDGRIYGSPSYGYHEAYIFYNKTYFNEKRIKDPYTEYYKKNNWNFETFKQVARDATTFGKDGKTVDTYGFATWNYFAFLQAAGNSSIVEAGKGKWKVTVDQPSGLAALQLLYDCNMNNWFTPNISGYTEFMERKTAMLIERPGNAMGGNDCYNRMSDEIGMVPMPKWRNSDKYYAATTADGKGVPTCSKNPAGAAMFIYEYTKAERDRHFAKSGYGYEQRRRMLSDEHYAIREDYIKKAELNVSLIDGLAGWYNENRQDFFDIIFKEKSKPANAIDKMLPLINSSLKKTVG